MYPKGAKNVDFFLLYNLLFFSDLLQFCCKQLLGQQSGCK